MEHSLTAHCEAQFSGKSGGTLSRPAAALRLPERPAEDSVRRDAEHHTRGRVCSPRRFGAANVSETSYGTAHHQVIERDKFVPPEPITRGVPAGLPPTGKHRKQIKRCDFEARIVPGSKVIILQIFHWGGV
jgi:hypothetical protein